MNRTKIEWCDFTINPVKGLCPMVCSYCYARRMYKRLKWNPRLRYDPSAWLGLGSLRKPSRIFVGSTMELFHHRMNPKWLKWIMEVPLEFPQHTFIFLTKQPQNLIKFSPFPNNAWVGVTACNAKMAEEAGFWLWGIKAKIKFVSFEPLLEHIPTHFADYISEDIEGIKWVIIGAQTNPYKPPEIEWVREIVQAADTVGIPVFLKDNLRPLLIPEDCSKPNYLTEDIFWASEKAQLRQEMPEILYCSTCRVRRR